ncbi:MULTISPECIES: hypothetical protein [unclassified Carboxylicivirga]|uniref:hypothetical protein n=1 Tax=Carboxylicivirga TaxID=1628153 RepID=UPI003D343496
MSEKEFHKKYKALLEQLAAEAPMDVWDEIASKLDTDARELRLQDEEKALVDEVWNKLEDELDIDQVWGNIDGQLNATQKRPFYRSMRYWLAAAMVFLVMGLISVLHLFTRDLSQPSLVDRGKQGTQQDAEEVNLKDALRTHQIKRDTVKNVRGVYWLDEEKIADNSLATEPSNKNITAPIKVLREEPDAPANNLFSPNEESSTFAGSTTNASGSLLTTPMLAYLSEQPPAIDLSGDYTLSPELVLPQEDTPFEHWMKAFNLPDLVDEKDVLAYDRKDSRWTAGVVTAIKNTYLINGETIDGFSSSGYSDAKITIQPDWGLNVQYALNQRLVLSTNVFLSSSSKQSSSTYQYGEYVSKETALTYVATELALKQNAKRSLLGDKVIRRNMAGIYVAQMSAASETQTGTSSDVSSKYANYDYGVLLGQEFELRSKGPVKLSAGMVAKFGIPNVYQGDADTPGHLNKTHNASIEFRVGIAYRWKTKVGVDRYLGDLKK